MTKTEKAWLLKLAQVVDAQTVVIQAMAADLATLKNRAVAADALKNRVIAGELAALKARQ